MTELKSTEIEDSEDNVSFSSLASVFGCLSNVEHQERAIQLKKLQDELLEFKKMVAILVKLPLFKYIRIGYLNEFLSKNNYPLFEIKEDLDIETKTWSEKISKYFLQELLPLFKFIHETFSFNTTDDDSSFEKWFMHEEKSLLP